MVMVMGCAGWVTGCPPLVTVNSKRVFPNAKPELGDDTEVGTERETVTVPPPDTTPAGSAAFTWPHCACPPVVASTDTCVGAGTAVGVGVGVLVKVGVVVGVNVAVLVNVGVKVGVAVNVGVDVAVGVKVGV